MSAVSHMPSCNIINKVRTTIRIYLLFNVGAEQWIRWIIVQPAAGWYCWASDNRFHLPSWRRAASSLTHRHLCHLSRFELSNIVVRQLFNGSSDCSRHWHPRIIVPCQKTCCSPLKSVDVITEVRSSTESRHVRRLIIDTPESVSLETNRFADLAVKTTAASTMDNLCASCN